MINAVMLPGLKFIWLEFYACNDAFHADLKQKLAYHRTARLICAYCCRIKLSVSMVRMFSWIKILSILGSSR